SSRRRHTRFSRDWSSDVCSSDLVAGVRLLLAGAPDPALELPQLIRALRLDDAVTLAPDLDDDLFERAIAAVDVSLNLRWPTAGRSEERRVGRGGSGRVRRGVGSA